jgi:uncharacterized protein (TIGR03435 family)
VTFRSGADAGAFRCAVEGGAFQLRQESDVTITVLQVNSKRAVAQVMANAEQNAAPAPKIEAQAPVPAWEVVSIKPCAPSDAGGKAGGRGGGGGAQGASPDRLNMNCGPVKNLIRLAYVTYATGHFNPLLRTPIEGGPASLDSERYQIIAKAEGVPEQDMMRGPMLQALLEDQFKLKIRHETREVAAYALTVAKNGPKLQAFEEGSCRVLDFSNPPPPPEPGQRPLPICGLAMRRRSGTNVSWELHGASFDDLSRALGGDLDRIVVNKAGVAGRFDFHLEFAPDETTAGLNALRVAGGEPAFPQPSASDPAGAPSIFTAIQEQLGLKLESAKGPREFLIIDRAEKPSEN